MDEFFTCDSATSPCARNLDIMTQTCVDLGFTLNPSKLVHPSTCLTLLGIEIDSVRQETQIEASRLNDTLALLAAWEGRSHCTKHQLQSLLGSLNFICNVCRPGRTFMRRLVDLLSKHCSLSHHMHLTCQSKQDIRWWSTFLLQWNGKSLFYDDFWSSNLSCHLFTDACKHSFGAFFNGAWFFSTFKACQVPIRLHPYQSSTGNTSSESKVVFHPRLADSTQRTYSAT